MDNRRITAEALERLSECDDPRLREVMTSVIEHVHEIVREVKPSMEEWRKAIDFLTDVGHWSDEKRQEFIILSDTLGVTMLVDAICH